MKILLIWLNVLLLSVFEIHGYNQSLVTSSNQSLSQKNEFFSPNVLATCRGGFMTIKVETESNFEGVVHSRDYRKPECSAFGEKSQVTLLRVNLLATKEDKEYCGVFHNPLNSEDRSVAIAVRNHKSLELAKDKFYMITCGRAGFLNTRNQTSLVTLQILQRGKRVDQATYGRSYTLRAVTTKPDGKFGMIVKRCFSFSDTNNTVELVNEFGCSLRDIISPFTYDRTHGVAEATLYSMFKFPESNRVHFQCDILVCSGKCNSVDCLKDSNNSSLEIRDPRSNAFFQTPYDGALMASYSVFVVEPGHVESEVDICSNCAGNPQWLLYLCIAFGILFLVMLLINVLLCSAMTCSRTPTEFVEKEFDPYARSWHDSQYGSRYSLNVPSGTSIKPSASHSIENSQSVSSNGSEYGLPAVYGVPIRPSSRYSNPSTKFRGQNSSSSVSTHYSKYSNGRLVLK